MSLAAGCKPSDEITSTTEPRVKEERPPALIPPRVNPHGAKDDLKVPTRILGIIASQGDGNSWFFKAMGPADLLDKEAAAFDEFLASLAFDGGAKVTWKLPAGWRDGPEKQGRYATLLLGPGKDAIELSVLSLGGNLLDNINRWRGQVGLDPLPLEQMGDTAKEVSTKQGKKVTRVDLSGTAGKGPAMPPFMKK